MINLHTIAILLFVFVNYPAYGEIFHCKDKSGNTIFKDSDCSSSESQIDKYSYEDTSADETKDLKPDNKLEVIYQGKERGLDTRFVKVAVFEETDTYLTLEVTGYYSGTPRGRMQFRVVPNTRWAYTGDVHATRRGYVTAYTRISLSSEAEDTETSDILSLQLWHYYKENGKNKANRLDMLTVPYKKEWTKE